MNAGIPLGQLSACFVLPVEDKLDGIFSTLRHAALIQQSGGGTGFNFSHLRPANDPVKDHAGTASGPVSFMKVFDSATEHIRQGGKRRGANMGILNIDHPDILAFITAKRSQGVLRNFNISVGMSDAFMQALERNADWPLIHPNSGEAVRHIPAVDIWQELILSAWQTGDPGLIFLMPSTGRIQRLTWAKSNLRTLAVKCLYCHMNPVTLVLSTFPFVSGATLRKYIGISCLKRFACR